MKTVGLPISHKENEKRRTLVPNDIQYIKHPEKIFIEDGYGDVLGYSNNDYSQHGVNIATREEVLMYLPPSGGVNDHGYDLPVSKRCRVNVFPSPSM